MSNDTKIAEQRALDIYEMWDVEEPKIELIVTELEAHAAEAQKDAWIGAHSHIKKHGAGLGRTLQLLENLANGTEQLGERDHE